MREIVVWWRSRWVCPSVVCLVLGIVVAGAVTSAASVTAAGNLAQAQSEAARLLGLLQLPPNATSSPSEPSGDHGVLALPGYDVATPNLVDAHAWWTVPGKARDALSYVRSHLPAGAKLFVTGGGNIAPGYQSAVFALPAIPGVLSQRDLAVTVVQLSSNTAGVRTDGEAVWMIPRPSWERIPNGARRVVVTARGETSSGRVGPVSAPLTLRGSRARRLVAFVNQLGIGQPGVPHCPLEVFGWVALRFVGAHGRTLATAVERPTGCASVSLTVGGRVGPPLMDSPSVKTELERIGAIPVCSASQLAASATPPVDYPSGPELTFSFTNQSRSVCRLLGFPRLVLMDGQGNSLPTTLRDDGAASVRQQGLNAAVSLDPQQAASFSVAWSNCGAPAATQVAITLPGLARSFTIATRSARRRFAPCQGKLSVGAVSPAP